jgi:hypothetical protein
MWIELMGRFLINIASIESFSFRDADSKSDRDRCSIRLKSGTYYVFTDKASGADLAGGLFEWLRLMLTGTLDFASEDIPCWPEFDSETDRSGIRVDVGHILEQD